MNQKGIYIQTILPISFIGFETKKLDLKILSLCVQWKSVAQEWIDRSTEFTHAIVWD